MSEHVTKNWQVEFNDETKLSLHFAMKYFTYHTYIQFTLVQYTNIFFRQIECTRRSRNSASILSHYQLVTVRSSYKVLVHKYLRTFRQRSLTDFWRLLIKAKRFYEREISLFAFSSCLPYTLKMRNAISRIEEASWQNDPGRLRNTRN